MVIQKYHILKEYANGVMDEKGKFFPYKCATLASTGTIIPGKIGVRFFIRNINITWKNEAAVNSGSVLVTATIGGVSRNIGQYSVAADTVAIDAQSGCTDIRVCMLTDTGINVTMTETNTSCNVIIYYADVDEREGEYSG